MPQPGVRLRHTKNEENEMQAGIKVTKPGYGYFGTVVRMERKFRTDWAVVSWEGAQFTVREYPESIQAVAERPARVVRYN